MKFARNAEEESRRTVYSVPPATAAPDAQPAKNQVAPAARRNAVDILGIGVQKSATSWAAHVLNLHPNVWIPRNVAHSSKEVMFWDRHYSRGLDWYARAMTPPDPSMKSMDVSPGYSRVGPGKIRQCREQSPDARVFILLRNPIYRDWSSLLMEATLRAKFDVKAASFVDLMVYYDRSNVAQFTTYVNTIGMWRKEYGEQLFIGIYDDLVVDQFGFYQKLCAHCGLAAEDLPEWGEKISRRVFAGPGIALPPQMQEFLQKKYEPMIRALEPMLDRDLSDWLSQDPKVN